MACCVSDEIGARALGSVARDASREGPEAGEDGES